MTTKLCATCGRELPLEAYKQHAKSPDGYAHNCRECLSQRRTDKNTNGGGQSSLSTIQAQRAY